MVFRSGGDVRMMFENGEMLEEGEVEVEFFAEDGLIGGVMKRTALIG